MKVGVIRNNLPLKMVDHVPFVALMGNIELRGKSRCYVNLFLANPKNIPNAPYQVTMGYTFDQLTCPPDLVPANDSEQADGKTFSSRLILLSDEILPWAWPDGRWKADWLVDQKIASETGRYHTLGKYPIPVMKLTPNFIRDCIAALDCPADVAELLLSGNRNL